MAPPGTACERGMTDKRQALTKHLDPVNPHQDKSKPWEDPQQPSILPGAKGWSRYSNGKLFVDGASTSDIVQGKCATCYFLAAAAALVDDVPGFMQSIFLTEESSKGNSVYGVRYFKRGLPVDVWVDGQFPILPNEDPQIAHSVKGEYWVMALEKSYAKLLGGYANIEGGRSTEALAHLTGCPTYFFRVNSLCNGRLWKRMHESTGKGLLKYLSKKVGLSEDDKDEIKVEKVVCASVHGDPLLRYFTCGAERYIRLFLKGLGKVIYKMFRCCRINCVIDLLVVAWHFIKRGIAWLFNCLNGVLCGIPGKVLGCFQCMYFCLCMTLVGLVPGHVWGIVDLRQVGCTKLVQLRNPWKQGEWKGAYGDKSCCWKIRPGLKKKLGVSDEDDGTFWMEWSDFLTYFDMVELVHYHPKLKHALRMEANITEKDSMFFIEVKNSTTLVYVTAYKEYSYTNDVAIWKIRLAEADTGALIGNGLASSSDGTGQEYEHGCTVSTPGIQLKPGKYAVIVSCNYIRTVPMKVTFAIHSNKIKNCSFDGVCDGTSIVEVVAADPSQKGDEINLAPGPDGAGKPKE